MRTTISFRSTRPAGLIAAVIVALVATAHVHAQVQWSPPCASLRIINRGPCLVQLNLVTTPASFFPFIFVPPGGTVVVPAQAPLTMDGILSLANIYYPWIATLAPPPPPVPGSAIWWITAVTLGPSPGCCYDLFLDPRNCTLWMLPEPGPCNP